MPNWRSKSAREEVEHDSYIRDEKRSFKQARLLLNMLSSQNHYDELKKADARCPYSCVE